MSEPKTITVINWTQTLITFVSVFIMVGIAWGVNCSKINELERQLDNVKGDHELLISLNSKIDNIINLTGELKIDLKEIRKELSDHRLKDVK